MKSKEITMATAVLILLAGASGLTAFTQEKKFDTAKLYAEIAADYDFSFEDQLMTIAFWVDKEKLLGAPKGQEYDFAEVVPVDLENLKFEATDNDGQYYEIVFSRDEEGKIAKCVLMTQGMVIEGVRVKK
jgi:hypothetical protein